MWMYIDLKFEEKRETIISDFDPAGFEPTHLTEKVWCFIRYTQFLGAIFFGTFWISTNRALFFES